MLSLAAIESSYLAQTHPGPTAWDDPDIPPLMVLNEYLVRRSPTTTNAFSSHSRHLVPSNGLAHPFSFSLCTRPRWKGLSGSSCVAWAWRTRTPFGSDLNKGNG
jgi:hypothetical protein